MSKLKIGCALEFFLEPLVPSTLSYAQSLESFNEMGNTLAGFKPSQTRQTTLAFQQCQLYLYSH